jgi:hypothetical protein
MPSSSSKSSTHTTIFFLLLEEEARSFFPIEGGFSGSLSDSHLRSDSNLTPQNFGNPHKLLWRPIHYQHLPWTKKYSKIESSDSEHMVNDKVLENTFGC